MRKLFVLIGFAALSMACSDEEVSISMCNCEPDEYCVDDECHKTNSDVVPAPPEDEDK